MSIRYSVIIPTLNEELSLPHLLDSLCTQTFKAFEVIVVDGGSRDNTRRIAASYRKKLPLSHVVQTKKTEISFQRNTGARLAQSDWLVFVDADSRLLPDCLATFDSCIRRDKVRFCSSWFCPDKMNVSHISITLVTFFLQELLLFVGRPVAPGTCMFVHKQEFFRVGGFKEGITFQDQDMTLRLIAQGVPFHWYRTIQYVMSMRRFRYLGAIRATMQLLKEAYLLFRYGSSTKSISWYEAGGHVYNE